MSDIKLYSTHCARCNTIALLLKKKNIAYEEVYVNPDNPEELKIITNMGLNTAPVLVIGDEIMSYEKAGRWIKEQ